MITYSFRCILFLLDNKRVLVCFLMLGNTCAQICLSLTENHTCSDVLCSCWKINLLLCALLLHDNILVQMCFSLAGYYICLNVFCSDMIAYLFGCVLVLLDNMLAQMCSALT